jgi:hypothetical protein
MTTENRCRAMLVDAEGVKYGCIRDKDHPMTPKDEIAPTPIEELEMHQGVALDGTPAQWTDDAKGAVPHRDRPSREGREGESNPLPVGNDEESSHAIGMRLLRARMVVGLTRYGQPLQPNNGRDTLLDIIEEQADAMVYMITLWREQHPGEEFPLR